MTPLQMLFIPLCLACQEGTSNFLTCKCSIQCHVQMDIHVHVFFPVACDLCILASNHKIVGISTLSRKEHATAQTRELECTKIVLPQVVERGTCTCIYIIIYIIIYMYMGVLCCFALFVCLTLCAFFFDLICIFVYMYVYMWYTFTCVYMYCPCVCAML